MTSAANEKKCSMINNGRGAEQPILSKKMK